MPITATVHHPDGSALCGPGYWPYSGRPGHRPGQPGTPLTYTGRDEGRAVMSAVKAWWPAKGQALEDFPPPVGATIRVDGRVVREFRLVGLRGEEGQLLDVVGQWADVAEEAAEAARLARIAAFEAAEKKGR